MSKTLKTKLLEKYSQKEPQQFIQVDWFSGVPAWNAVRPDKDGHIYMAQPTYELMNGSDVRVFIHPEAPKQTVIAFLKKMAKWVATVEDWPTFILSTENREFDED